jgi:hypothetical protein
LVGGLLASGLGFGLGLLPDLPGFLVSRALDVGSAVLGRFHDRPHLLAGRRGQGVAAAPGRAPELGDLVGQGGKVCVDGFGVVTAPPDGEVLLLDALPVQRHLRTSRCNSLNSRQPSGRPL